jgi:hypothetical protein
MQPTFSGNVRQEVNMIDKKKSQKSPSDITDFERDIIKEYN